MSGPSGYGGGGGDAGDRREQSDRSRWGHTAAANAALKVRTPHLKAGMGR